MTVLLREAFKKASQLPDSLQDEIARELFADIDAESRWEINFKDTEDSLAKMAEKALADFEAGNTIEMGFDQIV